MEKQPNQPSGVNRRDFLATSAVGAAGTALALNAATYAQVPGANERIGVAFLGVNSRDGKDNAKSFEDARLTYPSLFDPAGKVALSFADVPPTALPCTLIIDRAGKVAVVIRNGITQDSLTPLVQQIAAEK